MSRIPRATLLSLLTLALATVPLGACLRDPTPLDLDDSSVSVHALLETGTDSAVVLLGRSAPGSPQSSPFRGVSGAEVRLISVGDTTWLTETRGSACAVQGGFWGIEDEPGAGCYRATLDSPVRAGEDYELEIRLADGTRILGRTVTPAPVAISAPAPDLRVVVTCNDANSCYGEQLAEPPYFRPVAEVPVGWEAPESVAGTAIVLRPVVVYLDGVEYPGDACTLGFSSRFAFAGDRSYAEDGTWPVPNISCRSEAEGGGLAPARFDSIRAELSVIGWNEHYVRYFESGTGQGVRPEAASQGIEGAYGVFGAFSRATRLVMLVRDADPPPDPFSPG